jgi:uncharacterized membrane protein
MIAEQELDKGLLTLKMIWFSMLVSLGIYLFLGRWAQVNLNTSIKEDTFAMLRTILYIVSFVTLFVTRYFRKFILSGKSQRWRPAQASQHPILQKYSTATIVALAMSESIGLYGLVLFFLGKNTMDLYLLILISAAAMLMYRPRKDEVISLSQASQEDLAPGITP